MTDRPGADPPIDARSTTDEAGRLEGADLARRRFFRQFAGEVVRSAATVTGAAGILQRSLAEASWASVDPSAVAGVVPGAGAAGIGTDARAAFRIDGDRLLVIDQRLLPDQLVEFPIATSSDAVRAIRESVIRGTPATAQIAALCLALTAESIRTMKADYARQATIRFSADALVNAQRSAAAVRWAVQRCLDRAAELGDTGEDGGATADVIGAEALRIVTEAAADHQRLADFGLDALTVPEGRALTLLTHGSTGWLAGGNHGTALGIVDAAVRRGQAVHVFVSETRPDLEGSRLAAWELARAGVPHTVITDGAAGWLLATRSDIDAVIVGAETIAANGETVGRIGTYPLAALAARQAVPFYVCAPLCSVDLDMPDASGVPIEQRPAPEVTHLRGVSVTGPGSSALNPASDVTSADLITAFVTEEGVLRPDFTTSLPTAIAARRARWLGPEPVPASPAGSAPPNGPAPEGAAT